MLSRAPNGGKCIYCAYQLRLKSLRLGRQRHLHVSSRNLKEASVIRFTGGNKEEQASFIRFTGGNKENRRIRNQYLGRTEEGGPVRKYFRSQEREASEGQGGRERQQDFTTELRRRLDYVKAELNDAPLLEQLRKEKEDSGGKAESFEKIWRNFTGKILVKEGERIPFFGERTGDTQTQRTIKDLRDAFKTRGANGLDDRIKYAFYGHLTGARFTASDIKNQQTLADLRYPSEWFPATRSMHRTIHLHVGPTNSGKTYHALQRLEAAATGVYAGPLRLLAHEVYTRMNAKGKSCSLVTGEERRMADKEAGTYGAMAACTVEMMPLNKTLDVAVIDEIQMIGNAERGWAWTQALLGVKAKEVHLCGEERTVPLVREICASLGEKLEIHHYKRLSPLKVADESLDGKLRDLRKGDCIVSFSVMGIHALRRQIERATGRKVATVYGSLPPETRAQQARLFNDPNNEYDFLVASDAVGMGLNLAIKRIIFEASSKYDGTQRRTLGVADIKQIAGRAGRYRIASMRADRDVATEDLAAAKGDDPAPLGTKVEEEKENVGLVTTLEKFDFPIVRAAMDAEPEPIRSAGIFPPAPVLERFASYFPPSTPFSYILTRLHELSQMHTRFHLCGLKDQVWIADLIEPVKGLTISDRNVICSSPASKTDVELWRALMPAYARCIAEQTGGALYEIEALPLEILEAEVSASREYLRELERLHKGIVTYLWLSYRFAGVFGTRSLAFHAKGLVEEKIEEVLGKFSFSEASRRRVAARREKQLLKDMDIIDTADEEVGEDVVAEEIDGGAGNVEGRLGLEEQTSLTSGGDRFAGEEDIGFEEPEIGEETPSSGVTNFVQWRTRETKTLRGSDTDAEASLAEVVNEGVDAAGQAVVQDAPEHINVDRPLVETVAPEAQAELSFPTSSETLSPEQDPTTLEPAFTSKVGLSEDRSPMETQREHLKTTEEALKPDDQAKVVRGRPDGKPGGHSQFGGVPPKHLARLDVDATEVERHASSRP